ncbi:Flagellar brake protein YcgR [bacterium HR17]|uniref:Flagellar brake protein YcgR n=1 Tax=Candidatus Fervidibacter japonicus TaxID=2035412 RepID=A0A2H5XCV0_9BACT|nr:Flagellar brake protein YcgR [bacterium HR17]
MDPRALLRRGQTVVLEAPLHRQKLVCVVDGAAVDRLFLVSLVGSEGPSVFEPGQIVVGYAQTPIRVYQFESVVLQSQSQPTPTVVIAMPDTLTPVQRRRFFRVEVLFVAQLMSKDDPRAPAVSATGVDISAGGLGVSVDRADLYPEFPQEIGKPVRVVCALPPVEGELPEPTKVEAIGEIVWVTRHERWLRMGIAFIDIDPKVREHIVAWCFAFQRRLLRMGLLSPRRDTSRRRE